MRDISILIGGKAGEGIREAGVLIARLLGRLGYRTYVYYDYPSLIRGGHNFSLVRASPDKVAAHRDRIDFLLALDQFSVDRHRDALVDPGHVIFNSPAARAQGQGIPIKQFLQDEKAPPIMGAVGLIGAFGKTAGIPWDILEATVRENEPKQTDLNVRMTRRGYDQAREEARIESLGQTVLPLITGNEAIALGLVKAGLEVYVAYPMTPSSSILHFLAQKAPIFGVKVIHPENEIAVMLMALGFSFAGKRTAVGTSGGGFCLMTEGLSLSGMAEIPMVAVVSQRPGPSTGVPTYTSQGDLNFVLSAGHGEFTRLVVAPGDTEEAFFWSGWALTMAWKYQIPAIVLSDKALSEGAFSFDLNAIPEMSNEPPHLWNGKGEYLRYRITENGVSPLSFPPQKEAVIKANSYEHDESGLTTEEAGGIANMQQKRLRKGAALDEELKTMPLVVTHGPERSPTALVCWGSTKGACRETAAALNLRLIQPLVLNPFPTEQFHRAMAGADKIICVENNATGQLEGLLNRHGFNVHGRIRKYDGRPFAVDELTNRIQSALDV